MFMKMAQSFAPDVVVFIALIIFLLTSNDVGAMIGAITAALAVETIMSVLRAYALSEIIKDNKG